jgi:hypothetical protein
MSAALLAKLKVKNAPQKKESVQVIVQVPGKKEEVKIKTQIVDKTDEEFNRELFIKEIQKFSSKTEKQTNITEPSTKPVEQNKPKKKGKKLKLSVVPEEKTTVAQVKNATVAETSKEDKPKGKKLKLSVVPEENITITEISEEDKPKQKRKTKSPIGVIKELPISMVVIGDEIISNRLPEEQEHIKIRASEYFMNNREIFINFMSSLFGPYKEQLMIEEGQATCERDDNAPFSTMSHQNIVRDYLNLYTPYRGLLLYHGLGSGKTCSSIAIAEGMKSSKQIIVMTPASLRMNYFEELKKCGDLLYRKNQYWEFIDTKINPELIEPLSKALSLSVETIKNKGGAWLVNIKKPSNFEDLDAVEKKSLDEQLNEMIRYKYKFINYNGMRQSHLRELTLDNTINPFDNKVIIIDEAHNFVSRIVNKMGKGEGKLAIKLYELLLKAENAKIILLTGTPIINYPNEIAVVFNILRGLIKTWSIKLTINKERKVSQKFFEKLFSSRVKGGNIMDYIEYKPTSTTLVITRNPFGFVNNVKDKEYIGVNINEAGQMDDENFINYITKLLAKNDISVNPSGIRVSEYKALPDKLDDFKALFLNAKNETQNMNLFKRRILGLASYFRSAQENLMPKYDKSENFHVINIPMSDFQFGVYEEARVQERKLELQNAKKRKKAQAGIYEETVSTYRIFSRAFCNFVFPRPDIKRPMPTKDESIETAILKETADEDLLDATSATEKINNIDGRYEADDVAEELDTPPTASVESYEERIKSALKMLEDNKEKYLSPDGLAIYSPKFLNILENIQDPEHRGLHLIYSQFRTLEGIGILKLVLEANGFTHFKIKRVAEQWQIDIDEEDKGKPTFALYTGTETAEEKEIIRNVFNGTWNYLPSSLARQLQEISSNNMFGEIIKVLMITASGAEGISLKNVRYVHITEPYWHPVRIQQVIGRARRICSHQELPETLRTVDVFLYLMAFSDEQLSSDESIELRLKDKSKIDELTPITSDGALYEIATIKEDVTDKILLAVKEASIDCQLHSREGGKEILKCFSFGNPNPNKYSFQPSYDSEETDNISDKNKVKITWKAFIVNIEGVKYALNKLTNEVYDLDSYKREQPVKIGTLETKGDKVIFKKI